MALKITRRSVDPITFQETWGGEYIPRIEDFMLDQTIASSMSYGPPRRRPIFKPPPPPPEVSPPSSPPSALTPAPPTPPKNMKSSATSGFVSPQKNKKSVAGLASPRSARSPRNLRSPRNARQNSLRSIIEKSKEDDDGQEGENAHSLSELSAVLSIPDINQAVEDEVKRRAKKEGVRFADDGDIAEINEISRLRDSVIADMFYESEDLANFRYEAFMEEAGLDPSDFQ